MDSKVVKALGDGSRLDVLMSQAAEITRSRAAALIAEGKCSVGGAVCLKAGTKVPVGTEAVLEIPAPKPAAPQAEDLPLEILWEDEDLAVINKPRGMVVHPAAGHEDGTVVNALLYHLSSLGGIGGELRPGIVHRLDRDTSGLLMVAKNDESQLALSRMLQERNQIEKHYRALVEGIPKEEAGRIELAIGRSKKDRKKMAVDPEGREAITEWKKLAEGRGCALMDVHILTGRTHQIRVHMKALNHPVCGDPLYGASRGAKVPCLMLHAFSLDFAHPRTGEPLHFEAPLPADFREGLRMNQVNWEEK